MTEDHFQNEEIEKFTVEGGEFEYKPTDTADELRWLPKCLVIKEGKQIEDPALVNKCKFGNLVKAPYSKELIQKKLKLDLSWEDLNHEQRWTLIGKLKPTIFKQITQKMSIIDKGSEEELKQKKN